MLAVVCELLDEEQLAIYALDIKGEVLARIRGCVKAQTGLLRARWGLNIRPRCDEASDHAWRVPRHVTTPTVERVQLFTFRT